MEKQYKNVARSKLLIREAIIKLLEKKKDITLITVTDVVKTANINRGTFYNHYSNINDVVQEIEDELMSKLICLLEVSLRKDNSIESFIYTTTDYLKQNEKLYRTIAPYVPKYILDDMKFRFLNEIAGLVPLDKVKNQMLILQLVSNSVACNYIDYLEGKLNTTLDELAEYLIIFLKKIIA